MRAAASPAEAFPWDEVMAIGLGVLRLSPRDFWAMTPREFARAAFPVSARRGVAPDRRALAALMADFPDRQEVENHG